MMTNPRSGTNVHEIAAGIYRINTPVSIPNGPGRFSFNQYAALLRALARSLPTA